MCSHFDKSSLCDFSPGLGIRRLSGPNQHADLPEIEFFWILLSFLGKTWLMTSLLPYNNDIILEFFRKFLEFSSKISLSFSFFLDFEFFSALSFF